MISSGMEWSNIIEANFGVFKIMQNFFIKCWENSVAQGKHFIYNFNESWKYHRALGFLQELQMLLMMLRNSGLVKIIPWNLLKDISYDRYMIYWHIISLLFIYLADMLTHFWEDCHMWCPLRGSKKFKQSNI